MTKDELKKAKRPQRMEYVGDLVSRQKAIQFEAEGRPMKDLPSELPANTEVWFRSQMTDIICFEDDGFTMEDLESVLEKAKDCGAIQGWEKANPDEYGFCRDFVFETALGDTYSIEWWKNMMYLKAGNGLKMDFHHIELGHVGCCSFGQWCFHLARFSRPWLGNGMFCASILCESLEQYKRRTGNE